MKTQAVLLTLLLFTCTFAACVPTKAQPTYEPHEDPTETQSAIDAYSFLSEYVGIFALMANRQYHNASDLNKQLSHITVPPELKYIINRYNQLTQELISTLSELQTSLDTASSLLDQNRLNEAGDVLERAGVLVSKAQILFDDLKDATTTLSQKMGVFAAPAQSKVREAYNQLESMLQRLKDLIDLYHKLLERTNQRVQEIKDQNLNAVSLTLRLNSTNCFVGSYLTAEGSLTAKSNALSNRLVDLFLDGTKVTTTTTDKNGFYTTTIQVPYKYVDSIQINTGYTPAGKDKELYLAALSPTIKVKVLYYKTLLEVAAPSVAYPGLPLSVNGKVTNQDGTPLKERQIKVHLDGTLKAQTESSSEGTFSLKFTVDTSEKLGKHSLTITAQANGLYAPATEKRTLTIQQMASYLKVDASQFIVLPARLQVTGTVSSANSALKGATVLVEFTNVTAQTKTAGDGSFSITLDVPLNTALAGNQELKVTANPAEPWQASTQAKSNVFALNSVSTGIALASSASVFAVAFMRMAKIKKQQPLPLQIQSLSSLQAPKQETPDPIHTFPQTKLEGKKGAILKAYLEALAEVQTVTGNTLTATMTLREYNQLTCKGIGCACEPFTCLTTLAEKSLYSPHPAHQEEQQRAEELKETVRRILGADK
jgi:hypothetical protein